MGLLPREFVGDWLIVSRYENAGRIQRMSSDPHDHHAHEHDDDGQEVPSAIALRVKALESLLVEKGLVDPAALDALIDIYENKIGPRHGARVVARAWTDPAYKARLLADGSTAIAEVGFPGSQRAHVVVVENTPSVHNLVVCTLCSCYPSSVLGLPPVWYKSSAYRSRAVIDPRGSGTRPPNSAIWCCQNGRSGPTGWMRTR